MDRPRWILANGAVIEWLRRYRPPFEAVSNKHWLYSAFGIVHKLPSEVRFTAKSAYETLRLPDSEGGDL